MLSNAGKIIILILLILLFVLIVNNPPKNDLGEDLTVVFSGFKR